MKALELFSGCGGLAYGIHQSGFEPIKLVELNAPACKTLRQNFPPHLIHEGDIKDFLFDDVGDAEIVIGGPPCQPFSLGGKHSSYDDLRDMFPYAAEAVRQIAPKAFIFENVKGLLRPAFKPYFTYIIRRLQYPFERLKDNENWQDHAKRLDALFEALHPTDYHVSYQSVNAADFGVPQVRERVFIVGLRKDINASWRFPCPTHSKERLLWDMFLEKSYWARHDIKMRKTDSFTKGFQEKIQKTISSPSLFPPSRLPWQTIRDAIKGLGEPSDTPNMEHSHRGGARAYLGHDGSDIDLPSKTIKAGNHGVPGGENMIRDANGELRYLTIAEAKRIQTFPDAYKIWGSWSTAMRQIGNAVPVQLSRIIGHELHKAIKAAEYYYHGDAKERRGDKEQVK